MVVNLKIFQQKKSFPASSTSTTTQTIWDTVLNGLASETTQQSPIDKDVLNRNFSGCGMCHSYPIGAMYANVNWCGILEE
jgi:hypothetical protein